MKRKIFKDHVQEMQMLIDSKDLLLSERRAKFREKTGRNTELDDEKLKIAVAGTTDDDDDLFVACVVDVEKDNYELVDELPADAGDE